MKDISIGLDQAEGAILTYEVADEALEAAAATAGAVENFTLLYCTAVYTCPT
jgi:hypothetical protein